VLQIALLFGASFYSGTRSLVVINLVHSVSSLIGVEKVINYFEEYPLKSSKRVLRPALKGYLDYKDWSIVWYDK
jgi:hypothetical protein